jgi:hypothetical protein
MIDLSAARRQPPLTGLMVAFPTHRGVPPILDDAGLATFATNRRGCRPGAAPTQSTDSRRQENPELAGDLVWLGLGLLGVLLVGFAVTAWQPGGRRSRQLADVAGALGLDFAAAGDRQALNPFDGLRLFTRGEATAARNLLHGTTDRLEVVVVDQHAWDRTACAPAAVTEQTVICFGSDDLRLPDFTLEPRHPFERPTLVNRADRPGFDRLYSLRGTDPEALRRLFRDDVLDFCVAHPGLALEGHAGRLAVYRPDRAVAPDRLRAFLEEGFAVFSLLRSPA